MNHWLQQRVYSCPSCQATYLHDQAYLHALFTCSKRKAMKGKADHPRTQSVTIESPDGTMSPTRPALDLSTLSTETLRQLSALKRKVSST